MPSIDLKQPVKLPNGKQARIIGVEVEWTNGQGRTVTAVVDPDEVKPWRDPPGVPGSRSARIDPE